MCNFYVAIVSVDTHTVLEMSNHYQAKNMMMHKKRATFHWLLAAERHSFTVQLQWMLRCECCEPHFNQARWSYDNILYDIYNSQFVPRCNLTDITTWQCRFSSFLCAGWRRKWPISCAVPGLVLALIWSSYVARWRRLWAVKRNGFVLQDVLSHIRHAST